MGPLSLCATGAISRCAQSKSGVQSRLQEIYVLIGHITKSIVVTSREMQAAAQVLLRGAAEHPGPTLTERELLALVIDFANGGNPSGPLLQSPGVRAVRPYAAPEDWKPTPADVVPDERLLAAREQLRSDLAAAIGEGFAPHESRRIREAAKQMVAMPADYEAVSTRTRPRQRYIHTRWYYIPLNLEALLARAVLWLRDETLGLGDELKQCALPSCRKFFFRSSEAKTRGRPRIYCSVEHMQQAHEATGSERTRRWRAKVAKHK